MRINNYIRIRPHRIEPVALPVPLHGATLTDLYREQLNNSPKFFKMDALSKLGFIASELLLAAVDAPRPDGCDDRAVVLFNRAGSLCNDRHYQSTIQEAADYFPSPALFVYTLPNIVTGEIAIRNKYYGETSFYVLDEFRADVIEQVVTATLHDPSIHSVLGGWLECLDEAHFDALLFIVDDDESSSSADNRPEGAHPEWNQETINRIYNQ
jgi:3-oxoacyl-[acyl-carrier-protein] synthase-1